jgi:hypothetical protein
LPHQTACIPRGNKLRTNTSPATWKQRSTVQSSSSSRVCVASSAGCQIQLRQQRWLACIALS